MISLTELPLRQKLFISFTILSGFILSVVYHTHAISLHAFNLWMFLYGMGIPMFITYDRLLFDLNNKDIFKIWIGIACMFLICYFLTKDNTDLYMRRSSKFVDRGFNKIIARSSASALKALPAFLLCYWLLNNWLKKKTDKFIVSTFRKYKWYSEEGKREINSTDVLINIVLLTIIIAATLIDF
jgi:hypothetical protein